MRWSQSSRAAKGLALGAVVAMALAACGGGGEAKSSASGSWGEIVDKANSEGTVTAYVSWLPPAIAAVQKGFEAKYPGIKVNMTRMLPPQIDSALDSELKTGKGPDVVSNTNYAWMSNAQQQGLFADPLGPEMTGANWKGKPYLVDGQIATSNLTGLGISYNSKTVTEAPKTYEDLLDPKYQGKVGIVDNVAPPMADMYAWLDQQYPGYVQKLKAQEPKVYASAVPIQEALQTGEISIALWGSNALVQAAKAKGSTVDWTLPNPAWAPPNLTLMFKESAHPNAAQVFYDYLGSTEGQSAVAVNDLSILPDVPGTAGDATTITPLDFKRVTQDGWVKQQQTAWRAEIGR